MDKIERYIKSVDSLEKLQELREAIENQERVLVRESAYKNLEDRSFNCIKESFEEMTPELVLTKEGRTVIGEYIKTINKNDNLKKLYKISEAVRVGDTSADNKEYLADVFSLTGLVKEGYKDDIKKLAGVLVKGCRLLESMDKIAPEKEVNEAIEYLASHGKTVRNLVGYNKNMNIIESYIKDNGYSYVPVGGDEKAFNEAKNECCKSIQMKLSGASGDIREGLEKMFEKMQAKGYKSETLSNDINNFNNITRLLSE